MVKLSNKLSKLRKDSKTEENKDSKRKNKEVDEYNEKLFESRNPLADQIDPLGAKVLIRLFKLHLYNSSGLWTGGRTIQEMSASEMKKINKQADESIQLQDRGVVIKTSDSCVNVSKLTPGTIIDLDPSAFHPGRMSRFIEKTNVNTPFDNYFIVPEFIIDNILKTN